MTTGHCRVRWSPRRKGPRDPIFIVPRPAFRGRRDRQYRNPGGPRRKRHDCPHHRACRQPRLPEVAPRNTIDYDDFESTTGGLGKTRRRRIRRYGHPRSVPASRGSHHDHRKELPPTRQGRQGRGATIGMQCGGSLRRGTGLKYTDYTNQWPVLIP